MTAAILPEALESLRTPLSRIRPDPANPNKHPKRQIEQIALSLQEFGQHQPIVCDMNGVIAVGEGRYLAAKALGWDDAAVVFVDDDELRRVRRNIADNQTARLAEMDAEALLALVQVQTTPVAGFDAQAMQELLELAGGVKPVVEDPGPQIDKAEELRAKWGVEAGQMWELGEHRVICGDCTDRAAVERVMGGEKAQFCVTSPPYPSAEMWETSSVELIKVGHDCLAVLRDVVAAGAAICWNTSDVPTGQGGVAVNPARDTMAALEMGWTKRAEIVWEKGLSYLPPPWNTRKPTVPNVTHELVLVFYNGERVPREKEGTLAVDALAWNRETVWKITPAKASEENHKAPFPVELAERCMALFSFSGDLVYDPFLGSGTTLIACERLGRRCRGIEISPAYVGVCLQRYADLTGQTPILLTEGQADA